MSTSTLSALVTSSIASYWEYITTILSPLFVFALSVAVVFGLLFFILRRVHIL